MPRLRSTIPLLLATALLGAREAPQEASIALRRGPCFGTCPVYEVVLRSDGTATYEGGDHAPRRGRYEGQVDPGAVWALAERLDRAGFWRLRVDEQLRVMDLPEAVVTARVDDRQHRVHTNLPPAPLGEVLAAIDSVAAAIHWTEARDRRSPVTALRPR